MVELRVGIIGVGGSTANRRAQYFSENPASEVVLCASRKREQASILATRLGCRAATSWKDLVQDDEVDAVCVATPNALHYEQTKAALENGKHVEVENPFCQTLEEAKELKGLAAEKHVVLYPGPDVRRQPVYRAVRRTLEGLGSIASAHVTFYGGSKYDVNPEVVGNMFLAMNFRFVDYFRGWFGEVTSMVAAGQAHKDGDKFMHSGAVLMQHEQCPAALIEFGTGYAHKPKYTMHILGSRGLLTKEDKLFLAQGGKTTHVRRGKDLSLKADTDHFVARVVKNAPPARTWNDLLRTMKVSIDCERSVHTGQRLCYKQ